MQPFERLDNENWKEAVEFITRDPRHAMIMLYDIVNVGMNPGNSCIHGHYFGKYSDSGLIAIAAVYGLGTLFIWGEDPGCFEGIGEYLAEEDIRPSIIGGEASQIEYVLEHTSRDLIPVERIIELDLMGVGEIENLLKAEMVEIADMDMLEELLRISRAFEIEQFGESSTSEEDNRFLQTRHIEGDSAFIIKADGRVVSKAHGLWVDGIGGQIVQVFTAPEYRSKGFASACVAELSRRILECGNELYLEVMKDNLPAIRAYEKVGYSKVAERKFVIVRQDEELD